MDENTEEMIKAGYELLAIRSIIFLKWKALLDDYMSGKHIRWGEKEKKDITNMIRLCKRFESLFKRFNTLYKKIEGTNPDFLLEVPREILSNVWRFNTEMSMFICPDLKYWGYIIGER
jgi:hypothetical protein